MINQKTMKRKPFQQWRWSKRGMLSILFLAILFNVIMGMLIIRAHMKGSQFTHKVGESAFSLLDSYQQANSIQFFVDVAASFALPEATQALAAQGFSFDKPCGTYKTIALWQTEDKSLGQCAPSLETELQKFFNEKLDSFFEQPLGTARLRKQNYDLVMGEGADAPLHGIGTLPALVSLPCQPGKAECGKLRIDLSFTLLLPPSLKDFQALKGRLKAISEACAAKQNLVGGNDLIKCVEENMGPQQGLFWESEIKQPPKKGEKEDRTFAFRVKQSALPAGTPETFYQVAIVIPDHASPPALDFLDVESNSPEKKIVLQWEETKALDVVDYVFSASQSEQDISCQQMFSTDEKPPVAIKAKEIHRSFQSGLNEIQITVEPTKYYCFAIVASDEKGNRIGINDLAVPKIRCFADQQAITCTRELAGQQIENTQLPAVISP